MAKSKTKPGITFQDSLNRAQAIAAAVPRLSVPTPRGDPTYTVALVRFEGENKLQPYGKRFLYRDQEGAWVAIDALISDGRLTGIALHASKVATQWVATLRSSRRRKNPDINFSTPAFVMTPGYNLHFLSFSGHTGRKPKHHIPLHDGLRPKARTKLLNAADLKALHNKLSGNTRQRHP